jgi:hypothetical protein
MIKPVHAAAACVLGVQQLPATCNSAPHAEDMRSLAGFNAAAGSAYSSLSTMRCLPSQQADRNPLLLHLLQGS